MRIYSRNNRRSTRYYLRIITAGYQVIDWWTLAAAMLLALCILLLPRPAAAADNLLYLPYASSPARAWFDQAQLEAAMVAAGYNPAIVTMHTWCELDGTSNPPAVIRYRRCHQDLTPSIETDGWAILYSYSPDWGRVLWEMTSEDYQ